MRRIARVTIIGVLMGILLNVLFCFAILFAVNMFFTACHPGQIFSKHVQEIRADINGTLIQFSIRNYAGTLVAEGFAVALILEGCFFLLSSLRAERNMQKGRC